MKRFYALISFFALSLTAFPLHANDPSDPRFYAVLYKICLEGLAQQGVKPCDSAQQFCMNKTYDCYRKANCTLSKTNPPHLSCDASANGCIDVTQYVADPRNFLPWDFRIAHLQVIWKMATGFGNDLNPTLDEPLSLPIVFERFEPHIRQYAIDAFDRLDDVRQAGDE